MRGSLMDAKVLVGVADDEYPWRILSGNLRAEIRQLDEADREIARLEGKKCEAAKRVALLEDSIIRLGGDLVEARKP